MNKIIISVLLFGGLFILNMNKLFAAEKEEILYQDVFLYKVVDEVYSLKDINKTYNNIKTLECIYPDSLIIAVYSDLIKNGKEKEIYIKKDYSESKYTELQKTVFKQFISFSKLEHYTRSHKIRVKTGLVKAFYLASNQLKCAAEVFQSKDKFNESFETLMKVELFLRSRFLPEEKEQVKTKKDIEQAILGIKSLLKTIESQITEEVYW